MCAFPVSLHDQEADEKDENIGDLDDPLRREREMENLKKVGMQSVYQLMQRYIS